MIQLRVLNLASNELSGNIPPEIGNLVNLRELYLNRNQLTGTLPAEFGRLVALEVLNLNRNEMRGPIPPEIGQLENLRELRWQSNRLDGGIPPELGDLVSLERLYLDHNQLSGEIPGALSQVPTLHLDHNQLSGRIPPELGGLDFVQLSYNQLTGPIPPELSLSRLVLLGGNLLTGDVTANFPEDFCSSASTIEQLDASENDLSGNIPTYLLSCPKLESLGLSHNRLQGAIPSGLSDSVLYSLDLAGNLLTGPVPPDLMNLGGGSRARIDLNWNGLFAESEDLLAFLKTSHPFLVALGETQTVAPFDAGVERVAGTSAVVPWEAIPFVGKIGGYEVLVATQSGGPYRLYDRTFNKEVESLQVTGLDTDTRYYFRVRTVTEPHSLNSNRIVSEPGPETLVRTDSRGRSILPLFSGSQTATGMAVASDSDNAATLDFEALDVFGNLLNTGTNPAQRQLLPGEQFALLDTDLFGQGNSQELAGWIDLGSDDSRFGSLFQILGPNQVDGTVPATVSSRTLYFSRIHEGPESFRGQSATTLVSLVNPHQEECQIKLRYHAQSESGPAPAAEVIEILRVIPPRGMIISTIRDLLGQPASGGFLKVEVTRGEGVAGFEFLDLAGGRSLVVLPAFSHFRGRRLYSPQVAWGPSVFSDLNLINLTDQEQRALVSLVVEPRKSLGETALITLAPREQVTADVATLLGLEADKVTRDGSLRVHTSGGVIGDVISGDPGSLNFAAGWPLIHTGWVRLLFSHLANTEEIFTGLAIDNPSPESTEMNFPFFRQGESSPTQPRFRFLAGPECRDSSPTYYRKLPTSEEAISSSLRVSPSLFSRSSETANSAFCP